MQRKSDKCRKKKPQLQREAAGPAPETVPPIVHEVLRSPGQPLDEETRAFMEPRFGHDFSRVRVHSRPQASIQAKLTVNAPGDIFEQEADRVADQVLAMPMHRVASELLPHIQRFPVQPAGQMEATAIVDQALASSSSRPLEPALRQDMEQRFGHDFSRVRVHSGAAAEQSARDANAHAYAVGNNMVFGSGQFAPGTHKGRRLIAHELAHVVQQSCSTQGHQVQRTEIPETASLEEFVAYTQQAIDDMPPGSDNALGNEARPILQGLRNRITLRDGTPGGTFSLPAGTFGLPSPVSFELVVDDSEDPIHFAIFRPNTSLGGPHTITLYARRFRGIDHSRIGIMLFHEAVHALFYLRREYPAMTLRPVAESALSPTSDDELESNLRPWVADMLLASTMSSQTERDNLADIIASHLVEEVRVIVETEAYQSLRHGVGMPGMSQDGFRDFIESRLGRSNLFPELADWDAMRKEDLFDYRLNQIVEILYGGYTRYLLSRTGVFRELTETGSRIIIGVNTSPWRDLPPMSHLQPSGLEEIPLP